MLLRIFIILLLTSSCGLTRKLDKDRHGRGDSRDDGQSEEAPQTASALFQDKGVYRLSRGQIETVLGSIYRIPLLGKFKSLEHWNSDSELFESIQAKMTISQSQFDQWNAVAEELATHLVEQGAVRKLLKASCHHYKKPDRKEFEDCLSNYVANAAPLYFRRPLTPEESQSWDAFLGELTVLLDTDDLMQGLIAATETLLLDSRFLYRIASVHEDPAWAKMEIVLLMIAGGTYRPDQFEEFKKLVQNQESISAFAQKILDSDELRLNMADFVSQWLGVSRWRYAEEPETKASYLEAQKFIGDVLETPGHDILKLFDHTRAFYHPDLKAHTKLPATADGKAGFVEVESRSILQHAAFLALTDTEAVSITKRGKLISERLFCRFIPKPPPEVDADNFNIFSDSPCKKEQMEAISKAASCKGCHQFMDPIGVGLFKYGNSGAIRKFEAQDKTECKTAGSGSVTNVGDFETVEDLSELVLTQASTAECMLHHLLSFSAGVAMEDVDAARLKHLSQAIEKPEDWRAVWMVIVQSILESK